MAVTKVTQTTLLHSSGSLAFTPHLITLPPWSHKSFSMRHPLDLLNVDVWSRILQLVDTSSHLHLICVLPPIYPAYSIVKLIPSTIDVIDDIPPILYQLAEKLKLIVTWRYWPHRQANKKVASDLDKLIKTKHIDVRITRAIVEFRNYADRHWYHHPFQFQFLTHLLMRVEIKDASLYIPDSVRHLSVSLSSRSQNLTWSGGIRLHHLHFYFFQLNHVKAVDRQLFPNIKYVETTACDTDANYWISKCFGQIHINIYWHGWLVRTTIPAPFHHGRRIVSKRRV